MSLVSRSCPVCACGDARGPVIVSTPPAESLTYGELKLHWWPDDTVKLMFSYVRCNRCSALYSRDYFGPDSLAELYGELPPNTHGVPPDVLRKTLEGYLRVLRRSRPLEGHFLEIGADIGQFTELCAQNGDIEHFWLFEPNVAVRDVLSARLAGRSHSIFSSMFDPRELPDGKISTAVMIHVLDHVLEPRRMLRELKTKLDRDARVLVVTHDESSFLARLLGRRWLPYTLQHPHLFNPRSLETLFEETGFRMVDLVATHNYFPVSYLVYRLFLAFGVDVGASRIAPRAVLRLKLGNMLAIATPA